MLQTNDIQIIKGQNDDLLTNQNWKINNDHHTFKFKTHFRCM